MKLYSPKPISIPALLEQGQEEKIPKNKLGKVQLTDDEQNLLNGLNELIYRILSRIRILFGSAHTKEMSLIKPESFTREDKLSFTSLLSFILSNLVEALDNELAVFFQESAYPRRISSSDSTLKDKIIMTEQEISKIRNEINDFPFKRAFEITREEFLKFKKDFKVEFSDYAVDVSVQELPDLPVMTEFFETSKNSPSTRIITITDCETSFIIDSILAPMRHDESTLFKSEFVQLNQNENFDSTRSNFIFDRSSSYYDLIEFLEKEHSYYLFRTQSNSRFENEDYKKEIIGGTKAREIKFKLTTDKIESLLSNLDEVAFKSPHGLYRMDWRGGVSYFFLKHKERFADFEGNTPNSIYQSFWSFLTFYNITVLVKMAADIIINAQRRGKNNRFRYEASISKIASYTHIDIIKAITIDRTEDEIKERIQTMINRATRFLLKVDNVDLFN